MIRHTRVVYPVDDVEPLRIMQIGRDAVIEASIATDRSQRDVFDPESPEGDDGSLPYSIASIALRIEATAQSLAPAYRIAVVSAESEFL
jgi:hypothetical protein